MPYIYKSGLQFGINETNIYGGASYIELTQAEYDALSDAEKHNGQIYFITDGNYDFLIVNDSVPVGSIQAYGGMTAPNNWLICDGSAVNRTEYSELFQAIGVTFGSGDEETTFNLPDMKGRVATGVGTCDGVTYTLGEKKSAGVPNIEGKAGYSYSDYNLGNTSWDNFISGPFSKTAENGTNQNLGSGSSDAQRALYFNASQANSHYGASNTVQPNTTVVNYIIKAKNPSITSGQQLQAMELFYPVGSYFETSDSTFDPNVEWGGEWSCQIPQEVLINTGSVTVNANQNYNLCTITLEPNTEYMIYTNVKTNNGSSLTLLNVININGTVKTQHGAEARVTTSSGQGVVNWRYVYTDNNTATATLRCYGYYTTSHTEEGRIIAVPINRTLNYKWHRTA